MTVIELYKQPKTKTVQKQQKKNIKLVIVPTWVDVVAKTDDEIYILSIIKIYNYFSFVFCCAKEDRVVENIESDMLL